MNLKSIVLPVAASLVAVSIATAMLPAGALAETASAAQTAAAETAPTADGFYRGSLVCPLPGDRVVRVPFDMTIANKAVMFARPIVNGRGQTTASETGTGTIEGGTLNLKSTGFFGAQMEGNYKGELAADGGALIGTQAWTFGKETKTRTCTIAFVKLHS